MPASTIAAIATPPVAGGIAVIRISGPASADVAMAVFRPADASKNLRDLPGYRALFGHFIHHGQVMDEVVALRYRAPRSYTGEDVVELCCHGGEAVSHSLLRACLSAGAVPAGPGEFTKRAFVNGRMGLTQAEAVMDLISAAGRQGAAAAASVLEGALARKIDGVRTHLVQLASHLAAYTDFPEEDVPELAPETLEEGIRQDRAVLDKLIDGYDAGQAVRRGVPAAIVGSPNVGKSTLLNLLSGFERAIVTPIAGTTRDLVEQDLDLAGIRLHMTDTAGLRDTGDVVEAEGIRRSYAALERAGLVLAVFDASLPATGADVELARRCAGKPAVAILNKSDLSRQFDEAAIAPYFAAPKGAIINISAKDPQFIQTVEEAVGRVLGTAHADPDALLLAGERQLACARNARDALTAALEALEGGMTLDAAGVCVDDALAALSALTGQDASADVIDQVFETFCVGK